VAAETKTCVTLFGAEFQLKLLSFEFFAVVEALGFVAAGVLFSLRFFWTLLTSSSLARRGFGPELRGPH
jgi:hypothetical protein